jgi:sugar transferase (PEP-CTERM/EpsH1 system associated)
VEDLLFLSHRIPFPPDKGDKIRSYNVLCHLTAKYRVHLGCFVDDMHDRRHVGSLNRICASVLCVPLSRTRALAHGSLSLLSGRSLSEGYFSDSRMRRWVKGIVAKYEPSKVFVYCSSMAPYAMPYLSGRLSVIDFADLDSEKWREYSEQSVWPLSKFYIAESSAVGRLERSAAERFSRAFFISRPEAELFLRHTPNDRVGFFGNGVDVGYFSPQRYYANPYGALGRPVVFTGRMDYQPNVDACQWFANRVFPQLKVRVPNSQFWIVGAGAGKSVRVLERMPGVHVTGRVDDVRPYLAHAECVVAPLQIARGIQNKVLEAMSMDKPVVATSAACTGLGAKPGVELLCADTAEAFIESVCRAMGREGAQIGARAGARVRSDYRWEDQLALLDAALQGTSEIAAGRNTMEPSALVSQKIDA